MEMLADISKVFGQEMAKLYSESISEDEMRKKAWEIWSELNKSNYWERSKFDREVETQILSRLRDAIQKILDSEEVTIDIESKAQEVIKAVRKRAEEKMIESASSTIAAMFSNHDGFSLGHVITEIVEQSLRQ